MTTSNPSSASSLARDSIAGLAERSSMARSQTSTTGAGTSHTEDSVRGRFQEVAWAEPPSASSDSSEASPSKRDADSIASPTACQQFRDVPWHPSEVEPEVDEENSEWAENMKVKNFFEGLG